MKALAIIGNVHMKTPTGRMLRCSSDDERTIVADDFVSSIKWLDFPLDVCVMEGTDANDQLTVMKNTEWKSRALSSGATSLSYLMRCDWNTR